MKKTVVLIGCFSFLLAVLVSCTSPTETATPQTPTATQTSTPAPVPPTLSSLSVKDEILTPENGVYLYPEEVNPGDLLVLKATVEDDANGTLEVMGESESYSPGINTRTIFVRITSTLQLVDIPIILVGEDNDSTEYILRITPSDEFSPVVTMVSTEIYAGKEVTLALHDLNGDECQVLNIEQVLGLGDKYAGNEYVTSQTLTELSVDGETITALANTPGNYRIKVTATDGTNETVQILDIPVYWAPGENPFEIRGVAIVSHGPPIWVDLNYGTKLIDILNEMGANYVQFAIWLYTENTHSNEVLKCNQVDPDHCVTVPDSKLRKWVQHAHSLGMGVLLKPQIVVGPFNFDTGWHEEDSWQIKPSNLDEWFESYTTLMLGYASLAQEEGVEIFCIGNELTGIQLKNAKWREFIGHVRDVYDGELTYSDVLLWQTWSGMSTFWDDLDYIGVPYYFNGSLNNSYPTIEEMVANIKRVQKTNLQSAMNKFEEPLLATEMGRPNFDTTNYDPWNFKLIVDNQEIIDWTEAAFLTQLDLIPRFKGVFIWDMNLKAVCCDVDWDFREKPLFEALKFWYSN
jgi:hypothetical protein